MKFSEELSEVAYRIRAYGPGWVVVNQQRLTEPFIITPTRLVEHWAASSFAELQASHLLPLFAEPVNLILLGTGEQHQLPSPALLQALAQRGIGFEIMNSAAACRTYSILAAEGRAVALAIFP